MNMSNVVAEPIQAVQTENGALAEIVQRYFEPRVIEVANQKGEKAQVLVLPDGLRTRDVKPFLDEYRTTPELRRGIAVFTDLDSFCEHASRFADKDSALFAAVHESTLTSVLDYHRQGPDGEPRNGWHRGVYRFCWSPEWQAWKGKHGRDLVQGDFADFIGSRIFEIAEPESASDSAVALAEALKLKYPSRARLLEISKGLKLTVDTKVLSAQNAASGEVQVTYERQHRDEEGKRVDIPLAFLVNMPVFRDGKLYEFVVNLRYRVVEHTVVWTCDLRDPLAVIDRAFRDACEAAHAKTGLPLFYGSPES